MADIEEKKKQVEEFLAGQGNNNQDLGISNNTEVIRLLNKIVENQEIDKLRWERNNPLQGDESIYEWSQRTLQSGYQVTFSITVPEGQVFFMEFFNVTYQDDTEYEVYIDGELQGEQNPLYTLTDTPQDFGDNLPLYKPPRACYRLVEVRAANLSAIAQTYNVTFRGFFRKTEKIKAIF